MQIMTINNLNVPILFLIFNRPDTSQHIFDEICKTQPAQQFVAADEPRKGRLSDYELCKKSRDIVHKVYKHLSEDDPKQKKPLIDLVEKKLGWKPKVKLEDGQKKTIEYFEGRLYNE